MIEKYSFRISRLLYTKPDEKYMEIINNESDEFTEKNQNEF